MLRRILGLTVKDLRNGARSHFFTAVAVTALLIAAVNHFVLPTDINPERQVVMLDLTGAVCHGRGQVGSAGPPTRLVASQEELEAALAADRYSVGLILSPSAGREPEITILFHGGEATEVRNSTSADVAMLVQRLLGETTAIDTQVLRPGARHTSQPLGRVLVPFWLYADVILSMLGFGAALIFTEKQEGTLVAYRVTPGRLWEYMIAKALSLALLGLVFAAILVGLSPGMSPDVVSLGVLVALGAMFVSLLAITVSSYFADLTQFLYVALAMEAVLILPVYSYFFPSFAPEAARWLPTYHLVFAFRQALLGDIGGHVIAEAVRSLALSSGVMLVAGSMFVRRQIEKARGD